MRIRRPKRVQERPQLQPLAAGAWMATVAVIAIAVIWATTAWLLQIANKADPGTDRARIRVDAVRTGLAAGAGAGAAVTLMLAFRRQRHQEIATAFSDHDAGERRITDLYTKAADQLGSDKAPVRLAGLYTLERLANDNPAHRQTIVNLLCAYLRMPYTPPDDAKGGGTGRDSARHHQLRYQAARYGHVLASESPQIDPYEERQVRLTAQQLLASHLRSGDLKVDWCTPEVLDINLTGATLLDFNLANCCTRTAEFRNAVFVGRADFRHMCVANGANFRDASFSDFVDFRDASFSGVTDFQGALFSSAVYFHSASFSGATIFRGVRFSSIVEFVNVVFSGNVVFLTLRFPQGVGFQGVSFYGASSFLGVSFLGPVSFEEVLFFDRAHFVSLSFADVADFRRASFAGMTDFDDVSFRGVTDFDGASFSGWLGLKGVLVVDAGLQHVWPPGWEVELAPTGQGGQLIRASAPGLGEAAAGPGGV